MSILGDFTKLSYQRVQATPVNLRPGAEMPDRVAYTPETENTPAKGVFTTMTGEDVPLEGVRAKATFDRQWRKENPFEALKHEYTGDSMAEGIPYRFGKFLQESADPNSPKTLLGGMVDSNPVVAGLGLAAGGGLLGLGAGWAKDKLTGGSGSASKWGLGGALSLGLLGVLANRMRAKEASMYKDPRNFILEKLQMANDVQASQKVQLASAVRSLDPATAQRIADAVHAAMGFGVGALLTKLLFGAGTRGTFVGGMLGVLGMALAKQLLPNTPAPAVTPRMPSYF